MSVMEYYEVYSLAEDGHLIASHPDIEDGRVEHNYDKNMFCLVHRQVGRYFDHHPDGSHQWWKKILPSSVPVGKLSPSSIELEN